MVGNSHLGFWIKSKMIIHIINFFMSEIMANDFLTALSNLWYRYVWVLSRANFACKMEI